MLVFITGATSGIGQATALQFAQNGHHLIITGRRKDRLDSLAEKLIADYEIQVLTLNFDVRNQAEVQHAVDSLVGQWRQIDILVNNAGLAVGLNKIQDGVIDDWERMIDTNVKGLLYVTRAISPLMIENGFGHIINIGSIAAKEVYPSGNVYCATKHAVDALNQAMRIDLLPHGIRVSGIHPGMVETEFSVVRFKGDQQKADRVYDGLQPLTAADIADTIYWVASRPAHININDILIMPTAQATATQVKRD